MSPQRTDAPMLLPLPMVKGVQRRPVGALWCWWLGVCMNFVEWSACVSWSTGGGLESGLRISHPSPQSGVETGTGLGGCAASPRSF
jgi:hypothetical protein